MPDAPTTEDPTAAEEAASSAASDGTDGADDERSPFLEAIEAPISEDAPGGDSVTYDEDFLALKTEIEQISSVSGQPDYEQITELARTVLTEKSKDLRAAGYLVVGEAHANGAAKMAEAAQAVQLLIDTYWEDLYPEKHRMRGRGNALQFVSDRLGDWVSSAEFDPEDRAPLVEAHSHFEDIQEFGLQEMGEHAPSFSGLINDLEAAIDALPEPEPDEPDSEDEPSPSGESDTGAGSPASAAAAADLESESDASAAVIEAASLLRKQDQTDPIPYRLLRAVQWGVLRDEPPSEGGTTRLDPPREQRRSYLKSLLEDDSYETLVQEGESSFQTEPFHLWLDLQRLVASALSALGAPYEAAHNAVLHDTARLVTRLPGLSSLAFSDGTPFASPLTVDWIQTQVRPLLEGDDQDGAAPDTDGQLPATEQYQEARKLLSGGDLDEALSLMREGAAEDASERETFHRRLYIAVLCMNAGEPAVARPLLDELDAAVEQHGLDAWNPSLALKVWTNRCQCYDALAQQAPADKEDQLFAKADEAFEKICRADAQRAVSLADQRPRSPALS